jgi:hypothetical protein
MPYVYILKLIRKTTAPSSVKDKYYIGTRAKCINGTLRGEFSYLAKYSWFTNYRFYKFELTFWSAYDKFEDVLQEYKQIIPEDCLRWETYDSTFPESGEKIDQELKELNEKKNEITSKIRELKAKRTPSKYNKFIAEELPKYKKEHPELPHKECFKKVAESWANHENNPKNQ